MKRVKGVKAIEITGRPAICVGFEISEVHRSNIPLDAMLLGIAVSLAEKSRCIHFLIWPLPSGSSRSRGQLEAPKVGWTFEDSTLVLRILL
jgi:hypothetical protein